MKVRFRPELAIPAAIVLVFVLLSLFGLTAALENRLYDLLLAAKPAPKEDKSLLLVDFDDKSVSKIGTWPISREIMADSIMLLREAGARYAVFDIEYLNKSPRGVNSEVLTREIPENFSSEFGAIGENMKQLVDAFAQGNIPLRDAGSYVGDFRSQVLAGAQSRLLSQVERIARDNDEYLAEAVRFFGSAFLTVNLQDSRDPNIPDEDRKLAVKNFALRNLSWRGKLPPSKAELLPAIQPISPAAKGLGFTNVVIDSDGVRRKIDLLGRYGDAWFPQLAFGPLLDWMGNPAITATPRSISLKGARFPDGIVRDLRIPLDPDGRLIINWPHKKYGDSFRHLSFLDLINHKENLDNLVYALKNRDGWGYFSFYDGEKPLLDQYKEAELLREAIMTGKEGNQRVADYRAMRDRFLSEIGKFLDTKPEDKIAAAVASVLKDPKSSKAIKDQYRTIGADAPEYFKGLRAVYAELERIRKGVIAQAEGSFAVLGWTSTGSTDIGVNPFDQGYANVGTHAAVANTIINRDFIDAVPAWGSALAAILLTAALLLLLQNTKPAVTLAAGAGATISILVLGALAFIVTGIYMPLLPPLGSIFFTFLALTAIQFLKTEREKGFIRNAFSHYLSEEVIKTIVGDPNKLKLGGELRQMTAVFTDIKGFSTISEKLGPEALVHLLNEYLTGMSDLILDLGGTIDKYEGDAIISFFGAPLNLPRHALMACQAAVRMKAKEAELNARFLETGIAPSMLLTRVGINTGDMVVGNMGTIKKMNYTIMGDSVNLAARLEGVNKQYGTWICLSESTKNEAGDGIIVRKLDRIRVVGKSQPIRIFELIAEKGGLSARRAEVLGLFEEALGLFESRDWNGAAGTLKRVLALDPEDGPSAVYLDRIAKYKKSPPPPDWDGVFNLTAK